MQRLVGPEGFVSFIMKMMKMLKWLKSSALVWKSMVEEFGLISLSLSELIHLRLVFTWEIRRILEMTVSGVAEEIITMMIMVMDTVDIDDRLHLIVVVVTVPDTTIDLVLGPIHLDDINF